MAVSESAGATIFGVTGAITFTSEWLQKGDSGVKWSIVPWTVFGMVLFRLFGMVSPAGSATLASIALITELTVPFQGRQPPLNVLLKNLPKGT